MLEGFSNPWEHIRLLADADRNQALISLLERHAPGATVLEVGCGSGLLSCIAARLGARHVYAVEPTPLADMARVLVRESGLADRVTVLASSIEDLAPRPVDFVFSELLNADPWVEGVLDAMDAAAPWIATGGVMAPQEIEVWCALVRSNGSSIEAKSALSEVGRLATQFDLAHDVIRAALAPKESYRYFSGGLELVSEPSRLYSVKVGSGQRPPKRFETELEALEPGPVSGAVLWFEATLDGQHKLSNGPKTGGHWGQLVCSWHQEFGLAAGRSIPVVVTVDEDMTDITPL